VTGKNWLALVALPILPVLFAATATTTLTTTTGPLGAAGPVPGIPTLVLDAYNRAAAMTSRVAPRCRGMRWAILAGIGKIESGHLNGTRIMPNGNIHPPHLGPRLDGTGTGGNTTPVPDTDNGRYDHDRTYDRAVGLMQILPSTWTSIGRDGNNDHRTDPGNTYDSALAAATHICGTGPTNLANPSELAKALHRYNHSHRYVRAVLDHIRRYDRLTLAIAPGGSSEGDGRITPRMRMVRDLIRHQFEVPYGIGCYRHDDHGEHPKGRACDFMLSRGGRNPTSTEKARGDAIATYAQTHARQLGIYYIIWQQRIWNTHRSRDGWRPMKNRGSTTQNHYDHVHISVEA
jgi:hypothetical protein